MTAPLTVILLVAVVLTLIGLNALSHYRQATAAYRRAVVRLAEKWEPMPPWNVTVTYTTPVEDDDPDCAPEAAPYWQLEAASDADAATRLIEESKKP